MLNEIAKDIHANAVAHGWWEAERPPLELYMLMVTELAEAAEAARNGEPPVWYDMHCKATGHKCFAPKECALRTEDAAGKCYNLDAKPEGAAVELIDCMIRILDCLAYMGIDIDAVLTDKHEYNRSRPYRHGGKRY